VVRPDGPPEVQEIQLPVRHTVRSPRTTPSFGRPSTIPQPCGTISIVDSWGRRGPVLLVPALLAICLADCGTSGPVEAVSNTSPIASLHNAITALESEPSFSLTVTSSPGTSGKGPSVYRVNIERPDRIAIAGALNVIVIGSTAYSKTQSPTGWTTYHHSGESTNYMNDMLMYINILKRAYSVNRTGDIYNVPTGEAASLLRTTWLPRLQVTTDVSYWATVDGGVIRSVSLHTNGSSSIAATTVVSNIGNSPAVTAPRSG